MGDKRAVLRVRVEPRLLLELRSLAERKGVTLSAVVRELLKRELAVLEDPDYERKLLLAELQKLRELESRILKVLNQV